MKDKKKPSKKEEVREKPNVDQKGDRTSRNRVGVEKPHRTERSRF